jgi:hypothetical protein
MVASRMRAQLSPSPVDHNKNTIWFTQWSRFIENKYVNIYASSRKICPYLFIFISNSQKIHIRCLLKYKIVIRQMLVEVVVTGTRAVNGDCYDDGSREGLNSGYVGVLYWGKMEI